MMLLNRIRGWFKSHSDYRIVEDECKDEYICAFTKRRKPDRRKCYDLNYFMNGRIERRHCIKRRK